MRETEIEIEETEVEVVYCDECGSECTDDHEYLAQEVCPSCASNGRSFTTRKSFREFRENQEDLTDGSDARGFWVIVTIAYPLFFVASLFDGIEDTSDGVAWAYVSASVGLALWGGAILALVLLL